MFVSGDNVNGETEILKIDGYRRNSVKFWYDYIDVTYGRKD